MPLVARLGQTLILAVTRIRLERARQAAVQATLVSMPAGSVAVQQYPDGTVCLIERPALPLVESVIFVTVPT